MKKKYQKSSPKTVEEAQKIAKATQRPGQTKEQTKLIAQGIQKGIEQFKKQQKLKSRELDKRLKQARAKKDIQVSDIDSNVEHQKAQSPFLTKLPWVLLVLSWVSFACYWYLT